jgi:cytochrome c oxidase subunit 4
MTAHKDNHSHHVVVPVKYYVVTFVSLLILTLITVALSLVDFGSMNLIIALLVAFVKASFVVWIFMGLRWDRGFNLVAFVGSVLFVLIFVGFVFSDIAFRKHTDPLEAQTFGIKSSVRPITRHHSGVAE